jgi:Flp pilus assembly protein TadG
MAAMKERREGERGSELIEFALVLPILLLIIAGIVDFGFLFQRYEVVTNAAREGARIAVLPSGYNTDTNVQSRVQQYLTASGLNNTPTVTRTDGSITLPSGLIVNTVSVQVDYPSAFSFIGPMAAMVGGSGWNTITLRASSTMRSETAAGGGS